MCFNLGKVRYLIDPAALVRKAAVERLGVDQTTATVLSGDFLGHKDAVKKETEEREKQEASNNEAWQRYYASRNAALRSSRSALVSTGGKTV